MDMFRPRPVRQLTFTLILAGVAGKAFPLCGAHHTCASDLSRTVLTESCAQDTFTLTGRVTHVIASEDANSLITLEDASGVTFMNGRLLSGPGPVPGDTVSVSGHVMGCRYPFVSATFKRLDILRPGPPPVPQSASLAQLLAGERDWKTVETHGLVRDVIPSETNPNWTILIIADKGTFLYVSMPLNGTPPSALENLIGRHVSVTGYANPKDGSKRTYLGRIFQCRGLDAIRTLDDGPRDPFAVPGIETLRYMRPAEISTQERRRATGLVSTCWGGRHALISTPAGDVVRLTCEKGAPPAPGTFIEASGFPQSDFFHITLARATWRVCTPEKPPAAATRIIDYAEIEDAQDKSPFRIIHYQGQAIRLNGILRAFPEDGIRDVPLLIEMDSGIIPVDLSALAEISQRLQNGAQVEVTGICVLETDNWRPDLPFPQAKGFKLVVNAPQDIRVIANPPWWTPERLLIVIGSLLVALILICIWNRSLHLLAERRGRQLLREQLGHVTADLRTEERTRLAVELHDTLAQNLTGVSMEIEAANDLRGNAPQPMLDHLGIAAKALKSCRDELRNCLWDLRSQALDEKDMTTAILRTLRPCISDSRLAVRFDVPRIRLSDNTTHVLLRVIRELVVNAIRHGKSSSVKVAGTVDGDKLLCSVTDNGRGFDPGTAPGVLQGHFGLQGVRERIDELNGEFTLQSSPDKGTKAVIAIPIPHEGK